VVCVDINGGDVGESCIEGKIRDGSEILELWIGVIAGVLIRDRTCSFE
jgi:hypothetical protein